MAKSRRMRWAGHVARMKAKRNSYRIFGGKPEGKRLLERHRRMRMDNIKMDLKEIGWGVLDWTEVFQNKEKRRALVNAVINFRVP
jgi:hypothetical protein